MQDENGQPGYYEISDYTLITDTSQLGEVFVKRYYDAETRKHFVPENKHRAMGLSGLGSESGFIGSPHKDKDRFGMINGTFYEADVTYWHPSTHKYTYWESETEN